MISQTESGIFETIYKREDAKGRPLFAAKIDGATYDINATTFRGTERLRTNAYLMVQQDFCRQLSRLECCSAERIEYEIRLGEILDGTVNDISEVFQRRVEELEELMKNHIRSLERKVNEVHRIERNQGVTDLENALRQVDRIREPMLRDQEKHRAAYFDWLYVKCKVEATKIEDKQPSAWTHGPSKKTIIHATDLPKDIIRPPKIVEREKRVEVRVEVQPPPEFVAPSNPIEIAVSSYYSGHSQTQV